MAPGRLAVCIALFASLLAAQEQARPAAVLENTGNPMRLPFHCTDEDMQWAGMACSDQDPCPVYLELSGVEAIGDRVFAAGDIHSDTVTLYSVLLGSDDSGKTWREPYQRMRGAGLDHLQFADSSNGWISGETLFPLPQDPFLLATADAGKTWQRRPVFSETHAGSIQQFLFASKEQGSVVIDRGQGSAQERYELYETPDAGGTWQFKQASNRPIALPGPPAAPLWRVRADGRAQAFVLEHQQSGRWTTAAAFSVNLGACVPGSAPAR
jgi:photosystem II stability/assembly factor-like uncharacterized protein